jgi:uncharacterized protein
VTDVEDSLVIFARAPIPGKVKTRLMPIYSAEEACAIHLALLGDVLEGALRAVGGRAAVTLAWSEPADAAAALGDLPAGVRVATQSGGDLGERMALAIQSEIRAGRKRVVILGSDAPTLPGDHIAAAFAALRKAEVVIGPSRDGGYYLIGMSRLHLPLFKNLRWGTGEVLGATRARLKKAGTSFVELGPWHDVDTPEDLGGLWKELLHMKDRRGAAIPARTYRTLARLVPGRI